MVICFGVSDYWTCFLAKLEETLVGSFRLSSYHHFQYSCLPIGCDLWMNYFLGAVMCHLLCRADVVGCTAITSSYSGYLQILNITKTGFYLQPSAYHFQYPSLRIAFDFYPIFVEVIGFVLFQPVMISFGYQRC